MGFGKRAVTAACVVVFGGVMAEAAATPVARASAVSTAKTAAATVSAVNEKALSEYSEPSTCRNTTKQAYLLSLRLPKRGEACAVDELPWGLPS